MNDSVPRLQEIEEMADIQAVAEYLLEQHGSLDGVKANTTDAAVIAAAQQIIAGRNAAALPTRFIEIISAQDLTEVEKTTLGQFSMKYGTDGPTLSRLYKIFKALQS
jgi:hypothetical protein